MILPEYSNNISINVTERSLAQQAGGAFAQMFRKLRRRWPNADIDAVIDAAAQMADIEPVIEDRLNHAICALDERIAKNDAMVRSILSDEDLDRIHADCVALDEAQGNMGRGPY